MPYADLEKRKQFLREYYLAHKDVIGDRARRYKIVNKATVKAKRHASYVANVEAVQAKHRQYYLANREKVLAKNKRWSESNKDKRSKYSSKWINANPAKRRQYRKNWESSHPTQCRERTSLYKARKRGARIGKNSDIRRWLESWHGKKSVKCFWCNGSFPPRDCHQDHIAPLSKGGAHSVENLCVSCATCNIKKYNTLPDAWNEQLEQPRLFF